jgi:hypothetical protein
MKDLKGVGCYIYANTQTAKMQLIFNNKYTYTIPSTSMSIEDLRNKSDGGEDDRP